jgi:hypothetical protein
VTPPEAAAPAVTAVRQARAAMALTAALMGAPVQEATVVPAAMAARVAPGTTA